MLKVIENPDIVLMKRCIALARSSVAADEYPFAAVIAHNGIFLCESVNRTREDHDVNHHAEVVTISLAQKLRGRNLSDCTIYSTIEPCAQCAYAIREAQIGRVVYGLKSPLMGGHSRWAILSDQELSKALPEVFLPAPEIVSGFLQDEVETLFEQWNPLMWRVIKARGIFVRDTRMGGIQTPSLMRLFARLGRLLRSHMIDRIR